MSKEFDVVVYGATGFTGRLVAEYLCERYGVGQEVRWAIAGRNLSKLNALKAELTRDTPAAAELPIVVADSASPDTLRAMVERTRVVCTTVGPYLRYGKPLVAACVEFGADYCDLTGESPFIRHVIDTHHQDAQARGRRIVHCCGMDSIPSDLGVMALQEAAIERFGAPLDKVTYYMGRSKGGFSGGTVASMLEIVKLAQDPAVRRILGDPYALNPKDAPRGPDGGDQNTPRWDSDINRWTAPFIMGPINTRVVRRTNALLEQPYGRQFSYREVMSTPEGWRGWTMAWSISLGVGAFIGLAVFPPTRRLLESTVLPSAGEGPSRDLVENGYLNIRLVGHGKDEQGRPARLELDVSAEGDPGYGATSRMLAESALCLALDELDTPHGVLTPVAAMGKPLRRRLEDSRMSFEVRA